ncbi:MAG: hypothetical protein ABJD07_00635 [Gemmatimonadaceae bacterium]
MSNHANDAAVIDRRALMRGLDERRQMQLVFGGGKPRIVQPHAILKKGDGTEILQAYQLHGQTEKGSEKGWKHFELAKLSEVDLLPDYFQPRRDFRPQNSASATVIASVRLDGAIKT